MMSSLLLTVIALPWAANAPATQPAPDEQAIRQFINTYIDAYNKGDAEAVAALFTEDAEYVQEDGDVLHGRKEIREEVAKTFEDQKGAKLSVQIDSIEQPRRNMVIVRGVGTVTLENGSATSAHFRAAHVKHKDKWLIKSTEEIGEGGEALEQLSWAIGSWMDEDEKASIRTDFEWSSDRHFIMRSFT